MDFYFSEYDALYDLLVEPHSATRVPLLSQLEKIEFPLTKHLLNSEKDIVICSAALITISGTCKDNKKPYICYRRINLNTKPHGEAHDLDLLHIMELSTEIVAKVSIENMRIFEREQLLCVGLTADSRDLKILEKGVCRHLCLLVLRWSSGSDKLIVAASAVIEINDRFLTQIPRSIVSHQVSIFPYRVEYIRSGKQILAVFHPSDQIPCLLIYCMHRNTFVPVTGNTPGHPGVYVFSNFEFPIHSYHYQTQEPYMVLGKAMQRDEDGRSAYEFSRLILR